jgi:hypothetical protein
MNGSGTDAATRSAAESLAKRLDSADQVLVNCLTKFFRNAHAIHIHSDYQIDIGRHSRLTSKRRS